MTPMSPVLPRQAAQSKACEIPFGKDQTEQYLVLPGIILHREYGTISVLSRWHLTWRERLYLLFSGSLYLEQYTFGQALQPQRPSLIPPDVKL